MRLFYFLYISLTRSLYIYSVALFIFLVYNKIHTKRNEKHDLFIYYSLKNASYFVLNNTLKNLKISFLNFTESAL